MRTMVYDAKLARDRDQMQHSVQSVVETAILQYLLLKLSTQDEFCSMELHLNKMMDALLCQSLFRQVLRLDALDAMVSLIPMFHPPVPNHLISDSSFAFVCFAAFSLFRSAAMFWANFTQSHPKQYHVRCNSPTV